MHDAPPLPLHRSPRSLAALAALVALAGLLCLPTAAPAQLATADEIGRAHV